MPEHPVHVTTRRTFLLFAAAAGGAVALAACNRSTDTGSAAAEASAAAASGKGSSATVLPAPATLHESPNRAALVKASPPTPVHQRLPASPHVSASLTPLVGRQLAPIV